MFQSRIASALGRPHGHSVLSALLLCVCVLPTACGAPRDTQQTRHVAAVQANDTVQPPTPQAVTLVGRYETLPGGNALRFSWPNTAIGFSFEGDAIGIVLAEDASTRTVGKTPVHNMYEVVLDGEVLPPITVTSTTPHTFPIAEGLFPGPHTAWVIKRTEGMVGSGVLVGLDVPASTRLLPPPPRKDRRIEVYGASNEAGYGNLGKATREHMCTYSTATQNAAVAYPALAADALGAELVNISFSGKGIISTCTPGDLEPLSALADRIDPFYPGEWTRVPQRAPQVVMITLGANDFAWGVPNKALFYRAYGAFLRKLRRQYPQTAMIVTVTPMIGGKDRVLYRHWLQQIVAGTRDARITMVEFPTYEGDTLGCDYHPDEALHAALALRLQSAITQLTGWR